jgi:hypothetical protein
VWCSTRFPRCTRRVPCRRSGRCARSASTAPGGARWRCGFAYRVTIWLCEGHASRAFQTGRGGRDFVRTLMGVWQANGCLTRARHRALDAHLGRLRAHPPRHRPGSYAWPQLRRRLEARYAKGAPPADPGTSHACQMCTARAPSPRTLQRWHAERRRLTRPP